MSNYMPLDEYPEVMRDLFQTYLANKLELGQIDRDLKRRKAELILGGLLTGKNETTRNAELTALLAIDEEYAGTQRRQDELQTIQNDVELELEYRRNQFNVLQLQIRERIAFERPLSISTPGTIELKPVAA